MGCTCNFGLKYIVANMNPYPKHDKEESDAIIILINS